VSDIDPRLKGTLPDAARAKMHHHRGYSGGRADDPHGVTQDSDDLDIPSGLTKSADFSSAPIFKKQ
jgi:hypothetical protein